VNIRPATHEDDAFLREMLYEAAACVLTSSARIRFRMARTSDANRDCARVAILGSMARGTS
jgi:hypothetical protein